MDQSFVPMMPGETAQRSLSRFLDAYLIHVPMPKTHTMVFLTRDLNLKSHMQKSLPALP